jgi:hypothetical protein
MPYPKDIREALARHTPELGDGCQRWEGNLRSTGYGRVTFKRKSYYAHRVAWELVNGAIPEGMTVDHECHNLDATCPGGVACPHRACVRVDHLRLVTPAMNTFNAGHIHRTGRCKRGHEVADENVYWIRGQATCRTCHLMRQRLYESRSIHKDQIRAKATAPEVSR